MLNNSENEVATVVVSSFVLKSCETYSGRGTKAAFHLDENHLILSLGPYVEAEAPAGAIIHDLPSVALKKFSHK